MIRDGKRSFYNVKAGWFQNLTSASHQKTTSQDIWTTDLSPVIFLENCCIQWDLVPAFMERLWLHDPEKSCI